MKKTIKVEGIHCGGCEKRLVRALEAIPGVEGATADHVAGVAVVTLKEEVTDEALRRAIDAAGGFTVVGIG